MPQSRFLKDLPFSRSADADALRVLRDADRLRLLDGDAEILPDIRVMRVDGHHPGHQIVVIATPHKPVVQASDAVHQYQNLEADVPMGLFEGDFRDVLRALDTIRRIDGIVVAGHDREVMQRFVPAGKDIVRVYPP